MLNHIVLMGRLTRDVELRRTGSGTSVANCTISVDRDFGSKDGGEKETDFIDVVAQIRSWTDKDGNKRKSAEVVADNVYFGDSKNSNSSSNIANFAAVQNSEPLQDFAVLDGDDGELPF